MLEVQLNHIEVEWLVHSIEFRGYNLNILGKLPTNDEREFGSRYSLFDSDTCVFISGKFDGLIRRDKPGFLFHLIIKELPKDDWLGSNFLLK